MFLPGVAKYLMSFLQKEKVDVFIKWFEVECYQALV